jgi:hypothetical protein
VLASGEVGVDTTLKIAKLGDGTTAWAALPTHGVMGPATATDNALARFDLTSGKIIQNSAATLSDAGLLTAAALTATGAINGASLALSGDATVDDLTAAGTVQSLRSIVTGRWQRSVQTTTSANAILTVDHPSYQEVTTGAVARTVQLPLTTIPGITFQIIKLDAGAGAVTVLGTINGVVNRSLATQYAKVTVRSTAVSGSWLEV